MKSLTTVAALLAAYLAVPTPASAGRTGSYALWCGVKGADLATTEMALSRGAREANPLMQSRAVRIGSGVGVCVAAGEVDHRLRKHGKLRWTVRVLGLGLMAYAVGHNMRTGQTP